MNTNEFMSWFQGFTENMEGPPNKKQWARIKEVVKGITGVPTPYWVYLRDYGYPYWHNGLSSQPRVTCGPSGFSTSTYVTSAQAVPNTSAEHTLDNYSPAEQGFTPVFRLADAVEGAGAAGVSGVLSGSTAKPNVMPMNEDQTAYVVPFDALAAFKFAGLAEFDAIKGVSV